MFIYLKYKNVLIGDSLNLRNILKLNENDIISHIEPLNMEFRKLTKLRLLRKKQDIYQLNPKFGFSKKLIDMTKMRIQI